MLDVIFLLINLVKKDFKLYNLDKGKKGFFNNLIADELFDQLKKATHHNVYFI